MKKKLISIALAVCLMFTFVSSASAATVTDAVNEIFGIHSVAQTTAPDSAEETEEITDVPENPAKPIVLRLPERYLTLYYGSETKLHASASEGKVVYSSSDPSIAKVGADGTVKAVGRGHAFITARVEGTNVSECCEIAVEFTYQHWIMYIFFLGFLWM